MDYKEEIKAGDKVKILRSSSDRIPEIKEMIGEVCEVKGVHIDSQGFKSFLVWQKDKKYDWSFGRDEIELVKEEK